MALGLIVGTGVDFTPSQEYNRVTTPYGEAFLTETFLSGHRIVFLRRHGPALNIPPHLINYRANIWALKEAGVSRIIATAAVGSLRHAISPGSLAVIDDFIDFTKRREVTFQNHPFDSVVHIDYSVPYCPTISTAIEDAAAELGISLAGRVTYLCVDGPRYETPAEVRMFAFLGADVVGMTGVPEVTLARELGMCYGSLAIVTNYAAGIESMPLSHRDVVRSVHEKSQLIQSLLEATVVKVGDGPACCMPEKIL